MSLDALEAWNATLVELGDLGEILRDAIQRDDAFTAISAMIRMRGVRAALARIEAPLSVKGAIEELVAMHGIASQLIRARAAEASMNRWLERDLPGDARLLSTPLGIAALADSILPASWDVSSDLVILIGDALAPVAELLADLGQRRIILVGTAAIPQAICVHSPDEIAPAVRTMVPGPPSLLAVRAIAGTDADSVRTVTDTAREAMSDLRVHRNTVLAFSRTWVEQGLENLPSIARWPSVADVGERFAGVPMVIVAPGPSLRRNVDQLKALQGRAIITAFSHSLKPVLAAGITPDLVLTVDPQDVRYHFAGCDVSKTCLVNAATVHPALFGLPAARFLTMSANCAIDDWIFDALGGDAVVPGGGSVATSAFSLALKWRCDPIVFVGLDLSFPNGEYYISTSSDGAARAERREDGTMQVTGWSDGFRAMKASGGPGAAAERCVELPGWAGGTVPSSFMFALFHRWFTERMTAVGDSVRVYNCTEGGAAITGMTHVPLAEVAPLLPPHVDVAGVLDAARGAPERAKTLSTHLRKLLRGLRHARRLGSVARYELGRGEDTPHLRRIENALVRAMQPLSFASMLAQREVERASDLAHRPAEAGAYAAASTALLSALDRVIAQLEPRLARALSELA